jgi:hypothetical protein
MVDSDVRSNRIDGTLSNLVTTLWKLTDRLSAEERRAVAAWVAEQATKVAEQPVGQEEKGRDYLANRLVHVLSRLPNDIPPDAAQRLMDALLRKADSGGQVFNGPALIGLVAVANCTPADAAPGVRDRLRSMAAGRLSGLAVPIRIVDACLPLKLSEQEANALVAAATSDRFHPDWHDWEQMAVAVPLMGDQLNDEQLLSLLEGVVARHAAGGTQRMASSRLFAVIVNAASDGSASRALRILGRAAIQTSSPGVRNALSEGLQAACDRLPIEDLPALLDVLLDDPQSQWDRPSSKGFSGVRPEEVFRQYLEKLAVDHKDQMIAILIGPKTKPNLAKLQPFLPAAVLAELSLAAPAAASPPPDPSQIDLRVKDLLARDPKSVAIERFVALLKHPECVGHFRERVLAKWSERTGQTYGDNLWLFVAQAADAGVSADELREPPGRE